LGQLGNTHGPEGFLTAEEFKGFGEFSSVP
jgi:hypothetical protein